jgi:lambda repressor-like predicted transcriptional regulator
MSSANATANLLMTNVRTYLEVQSAFDECDDEIKAVIHDMLEIWKNPSADNDEKNRALATIVEALFPSLGVDFMEVESRIRGSVNAKDHRSKMDEEEKTFAERLDMLMKSKGITQETLAERTGVGQPAISNMLNRTCRPQKRTVMRFAEALDVAADELWPGIKD